MRSRTTRSQQPALLPPFLLLGLLLGGCGTGGGNDDDDEVLVLSTPGHAPNGPLVLDGNWFVYLEEETSPAGNQDLNGNGTTTDSVAVAVSMGGPSIFPLAVAATAAHVVGDQIYLEVLEADDGRDWNGDGMMDDFVLVHWAFQALGIPNGAGLCNAENACYVDDLVPVMGATSALLAGQRLYYAASIPDAVLMMAGDGATTLRALEQAAPLTPIPITHKDLGQRRPRIVGKSDDGLLFLTYDEAAEMADQNGDMDTGDAFVLALMDATLPLRGMQSTGLALHAIDSPVCARRNNAGSDWLVAFQVSEAAQGALSLNDRDAPEFSGTAWEPVQCTNRDTDSGDLVLHFLYFEPWFADPVLSPVRNTGLVGRDPSMPQRVVVVEGFVATVSDELSADCDLNADMDTSDTVARWTQAVLDPMSPVLPPGSSSALHALAVTLPGGSLGLSPLSGNLVIVVDETADSEDIDLNGQLEQIVGWVNPFSMVPAFQFQHATGGVPTAGASWMSDEESESHLPVAFEELIQGVSLNSACQELSFADPDIADELATWPRFDDNVLLFPGVGYALSPGRAGLVVAGSFAYFRVSEVEHGRDVNLDGDAVDIVLVRCPVFICEPQVIFDTVDDTSPDGTMDAVTTDGLGGAAFVVQEAAVGRDLNDNGFVGEDVILYVSFSF